jgi:hypothetical protein
MLYADECTLLSISFTESQGFRERIDLLIHPNSGQKNFNIKKKLNTCLKAIF